MSRFYITTPIYYVNDVPHIGTTYTTVAADILARYHRMRGEQVLFATGTDENATKVFQVAEQRGADPMAFVDQMAENFRKTWADLNISHDVFIRTTEPRHTQAVQAFFERVCENGDIYKGPYEGWYCVSCETYYSADEAPEVNGERRCPEQPRHAPLQLVQEENYFFALSKYGDRLLQWIEENPTCLQPEFRKNEVIAFIKQGLRDVCITRSATNWGIPVPGDSSQVIYVWFDALINYITLAGFPEQPEEFGKWWPADVHLVGKDIYVRFHCTLWPAMLMAAGLEPPKQVFGHGFWMIEGEKMSKALGNVVEPRRLAQWVAESTGARREIAVDAVRFFLFREMPFGEDGNFARKNLLQRFNSDLANDLGNALNRSLSMTQQNFGLEVPAPQERETDLRHRAQETHHRISQALDGLDLQGALLAASEYVSSINAYLAERKPWILAREGKTEELGGVLYHALEGIRVVATWLAPYMPDATAEIRSQLGLGTDTPGWSTAGEWGVLQPGAALLAPTPIFPRIDKNTMEQAVNTEIENLKAAAEAAAGTPTAATAPQPAPAPAAEAEAEPKAEPITIDDFIKVELRVAEVLSAERVPKSDKLLHLKVSLGDEERTVLAGMAEYYEPEALVGRKVIMVANLAPRKMRGLMSEGMLLAAEADGKVSLLQPDQDLPAGARIR